MFFICNRVACINYAHPETHGSPMKPLAWYSLVVIVLSHCSLLYDLLFGGLTLEETSNSFWGIILYIPVTVWIVLELIEKGKKK